MTGLCVDLEMHSVAHDKEGSDKGDMATNMNVAPIFLSALCNSQMLCVNIDFQIGLWSVNVCTMLLQSDSAFKLSFVRI